MEDDEVPARAEELTEALISMMLIGPDASEETVHDLARRVARLICAVMQDSNSQPSKSHGPARAEDV